MLPFLQTLHVIAAKRGDGFRPEFLRMKAEEASRLTFPDIQPEFAALRGDNIIPIFASMKPPSK
ncbi:hypothetical protein [Mesorhizobium captivum]|uniref:hypothetical protein n=1 Tax=Mesorhizobium captivum TaxID=3072319 RepID=UPI002A23B46F|nr:hypothetical protein [Mesorhizobium sp. VK23E]MDX8514460.1 hypothetical protein [Mesorhizobium sp. VK23E]